MIHTANNDNKTSAYNHTNSQMIVDDDDDYDEKYDDNGDDHNDDHNDVSYQ